MNARMKRPLWLIPTDGMLRRVVAVLAVATGLAAALVASSHVHGSRAAQSQQTRA
jgi:hypothetical protein